MQNSPGKILFSIDLEEFDVPEEYGHTLPLQTKLEVSMKGIRSLEALMNKHHIQATIFTTAFWAEHHPEYVRHLASTHEIASHTFYHDRFETADLARSRAVLSEISGQDIAGLRMPLMSAINIEQVVAAGYLYDSSLHPTWLPGRYNHLKSKRTIHRRNGLWILPASVTPLARIPVFWLAFKNFPFHIYAQLCNSILKKDGYLVFYVHPWEFCDLSGYKLPSIIKRKDGADLLQKLDRLFGYFSDKGYTFETHKDFVKRQASAQ